MFILCVSLKHVEGEISKLVHLIYSIIDQIKFAY